MNGSQVVIINSIITKYNRYKTSINIIIMDDSQVVIIYSIITKYNRYKTSINIIIMDGGQVGRAAIAPSHVNVLSSS